MELSATPSIAYKNQGPTISSQPLLSLSLQGSPHKGWGSRVLPMHSTETPPEAQPMYP